MKSELYKIYYNIERKSFFVTDRNGKRESDMHWDKAANAIEWAEVYFENENNTSGYKGIHYDKRYKNFIPRITVGKRKRIELGRFKTIEEAVKCQKEYNENN
jgi:glycyl-tRNA synthetase alpha subunit